MDEEIRRSVGRVIQYLGNILGYNFKEYQKFYFDTAFKEMLFLKEIYYKDEDKKDGDE